MGFNPPGSRPSGGHRLGKQTKFCWFECQCGKVCRLGYYAELVNHCGRNVRYVGSGRTYEDADNSGRGDSFHPPRSSKLTSGWFVRR